QLKRHEFHEFGSSLVVHWLIGADEAEALAKFIGRKTLHADKKAALVFRAAGPQLDVRIYGFPAAKVEIANAEIGALRDAKGLLKSWKQSGVNIIEDLGH